jgi:hypothetical protein
MAALVAIVVYSFAFLILILYIIDAIVQWRYPRGKSWKYFSVQVILIICIFTGEVILVVYNEKEVKPAILHGLQALSLLLSLTIHVRVFPEANPHVLTIDTGYDGFEAIPWSCTPLGLSEIFPMGILLHESRCVSLVLVGLCLYPAWRSRGKKSYICRYCNYYRSLLSRLLLASSNR